MPYCKTCNIYFCNRLKLDNRIIDVHNRRNCLICLPRGFRTISQYNSINKHPDNIYICIKCNKSYKYIRGRN